MAGLWGRREPVVGGGKGRYGCRDGRKRKRKRGNLCGWLFGLI